MRRDLLIAVAAGALGGLLWVAMARSSVLGLILGLMFSPIPLAMTTLGLGLAHLPLAIFSGVVAVAVLTGSFELAALYVVFDAAPVAILTRVGAAAERERGAGSPAGGAVLGQTLAALAFVGVLAMTAALTALPAGPDGLEAILASRLHELVTEVQTTTGSAPAASDAVVATLARVLPGSAAWDWAFRALISAIVAQALLARDGFARWPTPAYRTVAVPGWYIGVFGLAILAAWLAPGDAGFIAANAAVMLSLPLVLQGLAVVHVAIRAFGLGRMGLVGFYGLALMAIAAAPALIVTLGATEHFLQLRSRLMARNGGE